MIPTWILGALTAALGYLIGYKTGRQAVTGVPPPHVGLIVLKDDPDSNKKIECKPGRMERDLRTGRKVQWRIVNKNSGKRVVKLINWRPFDPLENPKGDPEEPGIPEDGKHKREVPGKAEKTLDREVGDVHFPPGKNVLEFEYTIEVDGHTEDPELYIKK